MRAFLAACEGKPYLLEPIMTVEIVVPTSSREA